MKSQKDSQISEGLKNQREYTKRLISHGYDFSLVAAAAFVRSIRDLGYKSNGHALDELVDNSIQSGAKTVHVALGFDSKSESKPTALAVIDDGHGMDPEMIRAAVMWGGTHREGSREGFGRFGYGLPSASVSIAKQFSVFSWHGGSGAVYSVKMDIDAIGRGEYRDSHGGTIVPTPTRRGLPDWVIGYINDNFPGGMPESGTVVVLESLDRLKWRTTKTLTEKLQDHFGVTYRNYLRTVAIAVQGVKVEAVDPLFLTAGARFFDNDATGLPVGDFDVRDSAAGGILGKVKLRYSYLPPTAFSMKYADQAKKDLTKARKAIMEHYNGLLILRNGRQLDLITRMPRGWRKLKNYDAFYKIEIDFDPALDEEFAVTTSKQQVVLSDRMWDLLRQAGVDKVMSELYNRAHNDLKKLKSMEGQNPAKPRASEQVMEEVEKFKPQKPEAESPERREEAEQNRREWMKRRAEAAKVPVAAIEPQLLSELSTKKYVVEFENMPGAPFYRMIPRGGQIVLLINEGHRFYQDVYAALDATPQLRSGLEILLFVIGESELESTEDRRRFYESERAEWSRVLNTALDRLREVDVEFEREGEDDDDAERTDAAA